MRPQTCCETGSCVALPSFADDAEAEDEEEEPLGLLLVRELPSSTGASLGQRTFLAMHMMATYCSTKTTVRTIHHVSRVVSPCGV